MFIDALLAQSGLDEISAELCDHGCVDVSKRRLLGSGRCYVL
jgi:hypothetical protein